MNFFILLFYPPGFTKFKLVIKHTIQRAQLEFGTVSGASKDDKGSKKHTGRRKKRKEGRGGRKVGIQGKGWEGSGDAGVGKRRMLDPFDFFLHLQTIP